MCEILGRNYHLKYYKKKWDPPLHHVYYLKKAKLRETCRKVHKISENNKMVSFATGGLLQFTSFLVWTECFEDYDIWAATNSVTYEVSSEPIRHSDAHRHRQTQAAHTNTCKDSMILSSNFYIYERQNYSRFKTQLAIQDVILLILNLRVNSDSAMDDV